MGNDGYAAAGGTLKLKGVKDSKIDKKRKKPKPKHRDTGNEPVEEQNDGHTSDQAEAITAAPGSDARQDAGLDATAELSGGKTEAQRKHEEMKRKRLDKLKKGGIKTHKERVEELNKYLSNLSEHHDMPRIGPG